MCRTFSNIKILSQFFINIFVISIFLRKDEIQLHRGKIIDFVFIFEMEIANSRANNLFNNLFNFESPLPLKIQIIFRKTYLQPRWSFTSSLHRNNMDKQSILMLEKVRHKNVVTNLISILRHFFVSFPYYRIPDWTISSKFVQL